MTSVLGGAGTIVASYLAHAKGTDNLQIYQKRVTELEKFNRECGAFIKDYGDVEMDTNTQGGQSGEQNTKSQMLNAYIHELRSHFEMLLGNFDR